MKPWIPVAALVLSTFATGCVEDDGPEKFQAMDLSDGTGPAIAAGGATEVWAASNKWMDVDSPSARAAGVAWPENSGLTWEQKYSAWIQSLETTQTSSGSTTFVIQTPYGERALPAPRLECAEVAITLRAAFSSWYHLPFFLKGWDSNAKKAVYSGHFGVVYGDGTKATNFPSFKSSYKDFEPGWTPDQPWPSDANLRGRHLGDDDLNDFLQNPDGSEPGAGAYFDELFLNKRVGYWLRLTLLYYGSVNLADDSNMIHVEADALRAGDVLLYRRQRVGSGHTLPVMRVDQLVTGKLAPQVASGDVPRRQPKWEEPLWARNRFYSSSAGSMEENYEGDVYATLGGGLRRWRTTEYSGGRWRNSISAPDVELRIPPDQLERIAARIERFKEILLDGSPEEAKAVALAEVTAAREHLRNYPASCAARINRENSFKELYTVMQTHFGMTKEQVDAEQRTLEDYVFGELVYENSKTCCWNSTTAAMGEIILDFARVEQEQAQADGVCRAPTVFKARPGGDGYELFRAHAEAIGRGAEWVAWSEDEACPPANVAEDTEAELKATTFCAAP
jgi:hypothetical protein